MKKLLQLLCIILSFSCKSADEVQLNHDTSLELISAGEITKHSHHNLTNSEENAQGIWMYYQLTSEEIKGAQSRTDDFRLDPPFSTGSPSLPDYSDAGYERDNHCQAGEMKLNTTSMYETFYVTNLSPQASGINSGNMECYGGSDRKIVTRIRKYRPGLFYL